MWKCPVCESEYGALTICPKCGFDGSCDYERYPTAFMVRNARSTRALRREWEQKQAPPRVNGRNINHEIVITPEQVAQGCRITAGYFGGKHVEVTIPANWKDGSVLRCAGQGYPGKNGGKNGDLILTVRVQQQPRVNGGNINHEIVITPEQAAQGCRITAGYFGGKHVEVTIPANWKDGSVLRCAGQGYPGKNGGKNGDLILTVHVQQPEPARQAKQTQQPQPLQQPEYSPATAAKKSSWLKVILVVLGILVTLAAFYLLYAYDQVSCNTSGSTVYLSIELSSIAPIRAIQLARAESLMETQSCTYTDITILDGHADEELMNWLLQQEQIMKITSLTLCCKLNDLTPLAGLTQLKYLCIRDNQSSDLTPLASLTQLETLDIANNQISDLTPLAGLTQLRDLYIFNNQISDLTPLASLTQLETLDIFNNQISDLTPLASLTQLETLDIANNQISDLTPLAGLTELRFLHMVNNQIRSLAGLENLTELNAIYAAGNPLTDTSALEVSGRTRALRTD